MSEVDMLVLLKKMQEQLVALERKVDILVHQTKEKSFNQEKSFSKPFRPPYKNSSYQGKGEYRPREDRPFDKNRGHDDRPKEHHGGGFSPKKKPFFKGPKTGYKPGYK